MADRIHPSVEALAVAYLTAQGKRQLEIAQILNLSQAQVSRLLDSSKEYIQVERSFRKDLIGEGLLKEVERRIPSPEIGDRLRRLANLHGKLGPAVHVVDLDEQSTGESRFEVFAEQAAHILRDLLEGFGQDPGRRVGVAWGSTLWYTVQAFKLHLARRPLRAPKSIQFIPLCGDPLIDSSETYADRTSSRIVSELSKAVNGPDTRPAWLGSVPALIPKFEESEMLAIEKLLNLIPQYGLIFGPRNQEGPPRPHLAQDLHMILTAAGTADRPLGLGGLRRHPLLGFGDKKDDKNASLLTQAIFGDIGGVLIPRQPESDKRQDARAQKTLNDLTHRWTGLRIEHLSACATRAFEDPSKDRPGVTLLTFGADHSEIVIEAVRRGLANHLIIGSDLEQALLESQDVPLVLHEDNGSSKLPRRRRRASTLQDL